MDEQAPYRVLCLDGGGMRGVYTATYLAGVAHSFALRRGVADLDIGTGFDLICGTSTGAIVGCALACGIPMVDVIALYERHGHEIFRRRMPRGPGIALLRDLQTRPRMLRAGTRALTEALEQRLGDVRFGQVFRERGIALAIPATAMESHRSWVFKTPHLGTSNHRDDDTRLVDACLASSAAPVFRSIAILKNTMFGANPTRAFADGGLWANNPVLVGLVEALEASRPDQPIEIFSLGTVPVPVGQNVEVNQVDRGLPGWGFGSQAASLSIDAQQFAYDNMARMLSKHMQRPCRIVRFPAESAPASLQDFLSLDDGRAQAIAALQRQAGSDVDMTNSQCGNGSSEDGRLICELFLSERMRPAGDRPVLGACSTR